MKKILTFLLILIAQTSVSQTFDWAFGGGQWTDDDIAGTTIDNIGNIYITGHNSFSGANIGGNVLESWGVYIAKFDSIGNLLWVIESDDNFDTFSTGIVVDKNNENLYVTGYYSHSISFGSFYLQGALQPRMFVVKISSEGNIIWAKDFGTISNTGRTYTNGIALDNQNNIYLAGGFEGTVKFCEFELESKIGGYFPDLDIFIAKLNEDGSCIWAKRAGGTSEDFVYDIALDNNDNVYISGVFSPYNADFGNIEMTLPNTSLCEFTAKYTTDGGAEWVKAGNQMSNTISEATCLVTDENNFVYTMGNLYGTIIISDDTLSSIGYESTNYFVKYNDKGDVIKTKILNNTIFVNYSIGSYKRKIGDLCINTDNSLFISSSYSGNVENNDFNLYNSINTDIFIAKYNDIGYFQWVKSISGNGNEISSTIASRNKIVLGGNYSSQQLTFDSYVLTNYSGNSDDDFFIVSLSDTTSNKCPIISSEMDSNKDYVCTNENARISCLSNWGQYYHWYRNETLINEADSFIITNIPGEYFSVVNPYSQCSDTTSKITLQKYNTPVAEIRDTIINSTFLLFNNFIDSTFQYSWFYNHDYSNIVSENDSINVSEIGEYKVSVKNICGVDEDNIMINFKNYFNIYPSPNDGNFTVTFDRLAGNDIEICLFDILGKQVACERFSKITNYFYKEMHFSGLREGVYIVTLRNANTCYSKKIQILKSN